MFRKSVLVAAGGLVVATGLAACGGNDRPPLHVTEIAHGGDAFQNPRDAVPGKDGAIFFTADGPDGPGVFVATSGTGTPRALAVGPPFRAPVGLTLSWDQETIFVADPQADAVLTLPVAGGRPVALAGSTGLAPRGVEAKGGQLYVTGVDPQSGRPAVLSLPAAGGQAKVLAATGLVLPDGVAVSDDGTVFVTDRFSGTVQRVSGGTASPLPGFSNAVLGSPAGIALGPSGSTLLVSALDPKAGTAQVMIVDITSGKASIFDDVIGANHGAGGLHRSQDGTVYAWNGVQRPGHVYRIEP